LDPHDRRRQPYAGQVDRQKRRVRVVAGNLEPAAVSGGARRREGDRERDGTAGRNRQGGGGRGELRRVALDRADLKHLGPAVLDDEGDLPGQSGEKRSEIEPVGTPSVVEPHGVTVGRAEGVDVGRVLHVNPDDAVRDQGGKLGGGEGEMAGGWGAVAARAAGRSQEDPLGGGGGVLGRI